MVPNVPQRISASVAMTTGSAYVTIYSANGAVGDVITADEVMFTAGPTVYGYADGASTGWVWNGTAHSSTSTGPGL